MAACSSSRPNTTCLSSGIHHGHSASQTNLEGPIYATPLPKHPHRSSAPVTPNYHNHSSYASANNSPSGLHYNMPSLPLPPVSYMNTSGVYAASSVAAACSSQKQQRVSSAPVASSEQSSRNYWNSSHATSMMYRSSNRHHQKRKTAVELLAETKPFFIKSDAVMERLQQASSSYRNANNKRERNSAPDNGRYNASYGEIGCLDMDRKYANSAAQTNYMTQNRVLPSLNNAQSQQSKYYGTGHAQRSHQQTQQQQQQQHRGGPRLSIFSGNEGNGMQNSSRTNERYQQRQKNLKEVC